MSFNRLDLPAPLQPDQTDASLRRKRGAGAIEK
jgi:hypothetical protein